MSALDPDELRHRAAAVRWYHTMDLGQGVRTDGVNQPDATVPRLGLPDDLSGRSVLDVGAWDGFYSFEAERRGAARVLATDSYSWGGGGWGTKASFELAREALGSHVEDRTIDVMDLHPDKVGQFDVVLFLGVLYHVKDPMGAVERVASVTEDLLILETEVDLLLTRRPAAAFYEASELNRDPTNWWGPNPGAVLGMLRAAGFRHAEVAWSRHLAGRMASWVRGLTKGEIRPLVATLQRSRFVFHARK